MLKAFSFFPSSLHTDYESIGIKVDVRKISDNITLRFFSYVYMNSNIEKEGKLKSSWISF